MRTASPQRGYAAAILLVLVVLGALAGLVGQLSRASASRGLENDPQVADQLDRARRALVNYAAQHTFRPGSLPCPDRSFPPDGVADEPCVTPSDRIGRLPWQTLGVPNPVALGQEPLWYAVAPEFWGDGDATSGWVDNRSPSDAPPFYINSNTLGSIRLFLRQPDVAPNTVVTANRLLAVLIGPGAALAGQTRPTNSRADYLEHGNADGTDDDFDVGEAVGDFNDRAVGLTHAEVFEAVEAVVGEKLRTTVLPALARYRKPGHPTDDFYRAYPYAVPFADPRPAGGADLVVRPRDGSTLQAGLLPISQMMPAPYTLAWSTAPASFTASPDVSFGGCSFGGTATLNCTISNGGAVSGLFSIALNLANAGRAFLLPLTAAQIGSPSGEPVITSVLGTGTASTGTATVVITGTISAGIAGVMTVPLPAFDPAFTNVALPFDAALFPTSWFMRNRWFDLVYYVVAPGAQPGGGTGCTWGATCLNIINANGSGTTDPKGELALVLMGRPYEGAIPASTIVTKPAQPAGQARLPAGATQLYDYLETDENLAMLSIATPNTPPAILRHTAGRGNFNDRVAYDAR